MTTNTISTLGAYQLAWEASIADPDAFWAEQAQHYHWFQPWKTVLEHDLSSAHIRWFDGATTNVCYNALDRHLPIRAHDTALIWEANDPNTPSRSYTYAQLHEEVCRLANALKSMGVQKGDRVCIYMPMVPQLPMALLACARIGAVHSVVFGGFSASALADRINDCQAKVLITADGGYRGAKAVNLKALADEALAQTEVEKVLVLAHTGLEVHMKSGRDLDWYSVVSQQSADCPAVPVGAEDMLFILYTSGSTGKPKGVVHTTGGYMVYAGYTFRNVFQYRDGEVFFCTADVGWITGHTYLTYGPLLAGATTLMFEGVPSWPDDNRFWHIIEKHKVNIFYTAPTAIRALMACGTSTPDAFAMNSLRVLGSVGEPINEEAWHWYHAKVGKGKCPVTDTWWQTETGGIMIAPLAGITPTKPGFATLPLPGVMPILVDGSGNTLMGNSVEGNLCLGLPTPGMIRTTYGDHERCKQTYFSTYPGLYFTGDGCRRDEDGYYRILGRVDDVINVSGHRIGTAEVEDAICQHPQANEAAVVGFPHPIKGQGIYAFVTLDAATMALGLDENQLRKEILASVQQHIGPIAKPDVIQFTPGLPKTRSGKIMRRILRKIVEQDLSNLGDTSTLLDPGIVGVLVKGYEELR